MPHFRKVVVSGETYEYKVGRTGTFIKGVGHFSHEAIGYCHDRSMDVFSVSPRAVRVAIRKHLNEKREHLPVHRRLR